MINFELHKEVFFQNIGVYISMINKNLAKQYPTEPLGKHIKILGGFAFKSSEYKPSGIPIIRISDFNNEKINLTGVVYYTEERHLDKYELHEGDVIIAMTGGTIGKLAIVQKGLGKLYLNQRVGKFSVINKNEFEDEYIYWIARGIQDIVQKLGYGGAQPNVSNKQLEALEFPFPPKHIQLEIISFLNALKDGRNNEIYFNESVENEIIKLQKLSFDLLTCKKSQNEQLSLLTALRQAILTEAVQGQLTAQWRKENPNQEHARELLKRIAAEKEQLIKEKKITKEKPLPAIKEEEMPYGVPEGWVWCRLGNLGFIQGGGTPSKDDMTFWNGEIPWVCPKDMKKNVIFDTIDKITLHAIKESSAKLIGKGSVLFVVRGMILIHTFPVAISGVPLALNQDMKAISPYNNKISEFVYTALKGFSKQMLSMVERASHGTCKLNSEVYYNFLIPLPPLPEQHAIVQKVYALLAYCDELEQQVQQSKADLDLLMQSVLSEVFGIK